MPLRDLFYVSNEYQKLIGDKKSLYASKVVKIPAPRFIVFYNGMVKRPEREWLKLSDLYEISESNPMLELQVLMLNINADNNKELKEKCSWTWTTMNGVVGCKVTGPNGNFIFFPAAGFRDGDSLFTAGLLGNNWSATPESDGIYGAYSLYFNSDKFGWDSYCRYWGQAVRPVTE